MMRNSLSTLALGLILAAPVAAQEVTDEQLAFVEGNVLSIFYHEFGHALIDMLDLPVLGKEEDAADSLAVVLTNEMWDEDMAWETAWSAAQMWKMSGEEAADDEDQYLWDVHSLDLQRHYTHVCLFYGANPEMRSDFVEEFELPEDRALGCEDEYSLAAESWDLYLDQIGEEAPGDTILMEVDSSDSISILLGDEVAALNETFVLPEPLTVVLEPCGEENAFYDVSTKTITMCTEYVDYLWVQSESAL